MKFNINFTLPSDAKAQVNYLHEVAGETDFLSFGKNEFFNTVEQQKDFIEKASRSKNGVMLIAKDELGNIIGSSTCFSNERRHHHVFTMDLTVKKKYWGRGIGTALIIRMESEAVKLGCQKMTLQVYENNSQAISLYQKLGYKTEAVLKRDAKIGDKYIDTNIMSKFLDHSILWDC